MIAALGIAAASVILTVILVVVGQPWWIVLIISFVVVFALRKRARKSLLASGARCDWCGHLDDSHLPGGVCVADRNGRWLCQCREFYQGEWQAPG